jgi:alanyl-tRNA synthetase
MGHEDACLAQVARDFIHIYQDVYESVKNNETVIIDEITMEESKFQKTIKNGLRELSKIQTIDGKEAFRLFETYGLPVEMIREEIVING